VYDRDILILNVIICVPFWLQGAQHSPRKSLVWLAIHKTSDVNYLKIESWFGAYILCMAPPAVYESLCASSSIYPLNPLL